MPISEEQLGQLQHFFDASDFAQRGWVITDLDGTAIHEFHGRLLIPETVEKGLKRIYDLGRPKCLNNSSCYLLNNFIECKCHNKHY